MLTKGVHVTDIWLLHDVTSAQQAIISAALDQTDPHLLRYLAPVGPHRLKLITFADHVTSTHQLPGHPPTQAPVDGKYHRDSQSIDVRLDYSDAPLAAEAGQHHALASLAATPSQAAQRVLTHELAHHVWYRWILPPGFDHTPSADAVRSAYEQASARAQAVSPYALTSLTDYWAETITALIHEPRVRDHDPDGLNLCHTLWTERAP